MMAHKAKKTLAALILVCTLPVAASYIAFYFWKPDGTVNYGELVALAPVPASPLAPLSGAVGSEGLKGKWTMVYVSGGGCNAACEAALYYMRQVRTAQGEHMERVARLWLVDDDAAPGADLLAQHEGLAVARLDETWRAAFAEGEGRISLVDPLGNLMMRFPANPEPKLMIKDLTRLLKYSQL